MAEQEEASVPVIAVTAAVGAVVLLLVLLCNVGKKQEQEEQPEQEESKPKSDVKKQNGSSKKPRGVDRRREGKHAFSHPWLLCALRGHSGAVTGMDFSPNDKYMATCAEDRSVLIFNTKDFPGKDHKSVRANIEYDHATKVKFSPDNKAFLVSLYTENTVRVVKIGKKPDGSMGNIQTALDYPKVHQQEIISIGIASNGRFIMTASKDTQIRIWDLKGEMLSSIDTHQVHTSHAAVSPCGRFVASSGFTADVKVWEVGFDKTGGYRDVTRAFELKGHSAGVHHFSFSEGSARMATVSKDGTWKLWDTEIEYQKGQEPYLLQTGQWHGNGAGLIAISPDGRTVAVATGSSCSVYDAAKAECTQAIQDIFSGSVVDVAFDNTSRYLVCAGDKHACVFHNVTGYKATILDLEQKRKKATNSAYSERLQQQIQHNRSLLESIQAS